MECALVFGFVVERRRQESAGLSWKRNAKVSRWLKGLVIHIQAYLLDKMEYIHGILTLAPFLPWRPKLAKLRFADLRNAREFG